MQRFAGLARPQPRSPTASHASASTSTAARLSPSRCLFHRRPRKRNRRVTRFGREPGRHMACKVARVNFRFCCPRLEPPGPPGAQARPPLSSPSLPPPGLPCTPFPLAVSQPRPRLLPPTPAASSTSPGPLRARLPSYQEKRATHESQAASGPWPSPSPVSGRDSTCS